MFDLRVHPVWLSSLKVFHRGKSSPAPGNLVTAVGVERFHCEVKWTGTVSVLGLSRPAVALFHQSDGLTCASVSPRLTVCKETKEEHIKMATCSMDR